MLKTLIIEDNYPDFVLFRELLLGTQFSTTNIDHVVSMDNAREKLLQNQYDIVFADLHLPDTTGLETISALQPFFATTPVIIFSGLTDEKLALEAIAKGAQDYLYKDTFNSQLLEKYIQYALERHKTQREINIAHNRFNFALKATADVIWDWNLNNNIVTWSKNKFGLPYEEAEYQDLGTMNFLADCSGIHKEEDIRLDLQNALSDRDTLFWEKRYKKQAAGKGWIYIHDKAYIIRNDSGHPLRVIGAMRDITALVESENELLRSEKRLQSIIDSSNECFVLLEKNFSILLFNSCAEETLLRISGKHLSAGVVFHLLIPQQIGEFILSSSAEVFSGKMKEEIFTVFADHNEHYFHVKCLPVFDIENSVNGILFNAINITQRVQLERQIADIKTQEQRKTLRKTLEIQEKERSHLGTELHDNINQLLAAASIQLDAGYNSNDAEFLREVSLRALNIINKSIQEIRGLSHEMVETASKNGLIHSINESIDLARGKETLSFHFDHSRFAEDTISAQHKLHVYRIFQELLSNIIKYAQATEVSLHLATDEKNLYLSIKDNGVGFDVEKVKKGIGLFNIANRVDAFNGSVEITSNIGEGTTTNIKIPLE
jgi:signal transduction histidine kinase/CheY-like chemotaxis protein